MPFFIGQAKSTMDQKGRISIPVKYRKEFSDDFQDYIVLSAGIEKCLYGWTKPGWNQLIKSLEQLEIPERKRNTLYRRLLTTQEEPLFDKQGRITIPGHLIEYADLSKEVLIAGNGEHLEIWNPKIYWNYLNETDVECQDIWDTIMLARPRLKEEQESDIVPGVD